MMKTIAVLTLAALLSSAPSHAYDKLTHSKAEECFIVDHGETLTDKGLENCLTGELLAASECYSLKAKEEFGIFSDGYSRVSKLLYHLWEEGNVYYGHPFKEEGCCFEQGAEEELELGHLESAAKLYELAAWDHFLNLSSRKNLGLESDEKSLQYFLLSATLEKERSLQVQTLRYGKTVADYALRDNKDSRLVRMFDKIEDMLKKGNRD